MWDVVTSLIGVVSRHMRSLNDAIEFIILCAFIHKVGYFDVHIRETLVYKKGVDLLASLGKYKYIYKE